MIFFKKVNDFHPSCNGYDSSFYGEKRKKKAKYIIWCMVLGYRVDSAQNSGKMLRGSQSVCLL